MAAAELVVRFDGLEIPGPEFAVYLPPDKPFRLDVSHPVTIEPPGPAPEEAHRTFHLTAPNQPGLTSIRLIEPLSGTAFVVNLFVTRPFGELREGYLDGYRVGAYPTTPLNDNQAYLPPAGFVEVNQTNQRTRVSPNFTLGEFTAKQGHTFPKFLTLRPELLKKLELIKSAVEEATERRQSVVIMSGYRTPYYNAAIGNVRYSRHVYGDAADIFVDTQPRDGVMDDLNSDGRFSKDDARWLYRLIDELSRDGTLQGLQGGLGLYGSTPAHGPFVHVDVRGHRARWGQ